MTPAAKSSALVFDFDGTIVDTETAVYECWAAAYRYAGIAPIEAEVWLETIGQADGHGLDVRGILCERLGVDELPAEIEAHRTATRDAMLEREPLRPGVAEWIAFAKSADIALAVASSSTSGWVMHHLERLELRPHFVAVSCADPPTPGKPDPTVYLRACAAVGVDATDALAIEDSTHGVAAAIDAGMTCLGVPGPMTRTMDFSRATRTAVSLDHFDPADWLQKPG